MMREGGILMKKGIIGVLLFLAGVAGGAIGSGKVIGDKVNVWHSMSDKHLALFLMMNQWVKVKQEGKSLAEYFVKNGYKNIAIYGMSYAGETLADELKGSEITVLYGIDKKADSIYADFDIVSPEEPFQNVDAVVVTSITFFDEIEAMLEKKLDCPIISLEDILYEVY